VPNYAFKCLSCGGSAFDLSRPASQSSDPAPCPTCHGSDTRRVYSFSSNAQIPKLAARVADADASRSRKD
jgi:putative FmdB family regulatory protein